MPLPIQNSSGIEQAISNVLEKSGIIAPREKFAQALESQGITIQEMAAQLAMLIYSAREGTRLKALEMALAGHGIELRKDSTTIQVPNIIFNINSSSDQKILNMFAPNRDVKTLSEMRLLNEPNISSI